VRLFPPQPISSGSNAGWRQSVTIGSTSSSTAAWQHADGFKTFFPAKFPGPHGIDRIKPGRNAGKIFLGKVERELRDDRGFLTGTIADGIERLSEIFNAQLHVVSIVVVSTKHGRVPAVRQ
jgi:hypothetical protein